MQGRGITAVVARVAPPLQSALLLGLLPTNRQHVLTIFGNGGAICARGAGVFMAVVSVAYPVSCSRPPPNQTERGVASQLPRHAARHTETTGQLFAPGVVEMVWDLTHGQPWLVNALAYEACFRNTTGKERMHPITADIIHEAKERLILRRDTHLDQLAYTLTEKRVQRVIGRAVGGLKGYRLLAIP